MSLAGVAALAVSLAACGSSSSGSSATTAAASSAGGSGSSSGSGSSGGSASSATGAPIKVGIICGCTGPYGSQENAADQVYKAWVKTTNASGGLNGHPIDLITKDDQGLPGNSETAAQTLISDHVDALVDDTALSPAWAALAQSSGIPVVGFLTADQPFFKYSDFYASGETGDAEAYAVAKTAQTAGAKNLGVIYCAESPSCSTLVGLIKGYGKQLGLPVTYSASISATAPNYTAQCVAAKQDGVTALAVFDVQQPIINLATDCNEQGYDPIYVTESGGFGLPQASAPGLRNNLWTEYSVLPFWDTSNPAVAAMVAAVKKYYPGLPNNPLAWQQNVSFGWAGGQELEAAVKASGITPSETPTPQLIVKGLDTFKDQTLGGWAPPLTDTAGKVNLNHCWFTARVQNAKPSLVNGGALTCEPGTGSSS